MDVFDYEKDYDYTKKLIRGEIGGIFKGIYYCSNEIIPYTLNNIDLDGKNVLAVIGSGDQAIHSLFRNANVDVFDICSLPRYYLYLRKWFIKYNKMFYPDFDCFNSRLDKLNELLLKVECSSEQEKSALLYWMSFIKDKLEFQKVFAFPSSWKDNILDVDELERFKNYTDFDSYIFDLCGDSDLPSKKYDYILSSNIIEHCGMDEQKIECTKRNLIELLNPHGIVICSQIFSEYFDPPREVQMDIFSSDFEYSDTCVDRMCDGNLYKFYAGYTYTKKY